MHSSQPLMMMFMHLSALVAGSILLSTGYVRSNRSVKAMCLLLVALPVVMIPLTFLGNRDYFARLGGRVATWMNGDLGVTLMAAVSEGVVIGVVTAVCLSALRPR